ncbi:hypothetical protein [Mesorhizobium sp. 2RAF21]|uniref:hypothetical protein n=1 Tax=Mesorhizobium sp. 2RAF21 TaxID=3232995 RepID=UPI003F9A018D
MRPLYLRGRIFYCGKGQANDARPPSRHRPLANPGTRLRKAPQILIVQSEQPVNLSRIQAAEVYRAPDTRVLGGSILMNGMTEVRRDGCVSCGFALICI